MIKLYKEPRRVAYEVSLAVTRDGRRPDEALGSLDRLLGPRDRRLARSLVYEGLRHRLRLDSLARSMVPDGKPPKKALEVLILGLTQLLFLGRVPAFAAVSETVSLAKAVAPHQAGLVNAVLARLAREKEAKGLDPERLFPAETCPPGMSPGDRLSAFYSYPSWLAQKAVGTLGFREARAFMVASNSHPRPTLRANPLKVTREELRAFLPWPSSPTYYSPYGLRPEGGSGPVESWPGFREGLWAIQDEASQLLALLAGEPESVLDCCAGLGGKTLALATVFPGASLFSVDTSAMRLAHIPPESLRLGVKKTPLAIMSDMLALEPGQGSLPKSVSLAVVDAPCTSLGVIRRRPDIKWNSRPEGLAAKASLQLDLLLKASDFVAPGGRLVYCVCTFTDEEGPQVLARFLARKPAFFPLGPEGFDQPLTDLFIGPGMMRLWPHKHNTDAFFYGLFERHI
ncbi:MAG: hypothetical protein LBU69_01225 [Deltaproteobacteria bacterium]|jgi:16S rRNA (cytosine967-C5)-methyltransferase|nr:hypothetical protein [Deltaproteobacteria bacterium]